MWHDDRACFLDHPVNPDDDPRTLQLDGINIRSPHPLSPSPQGEGGISIAGGHPQAPARGKAL